MSDQTEHGTEDSDYREQIASVVESHTPHDRVSEWQDINNTVTAVLAVPHPDTAEAARLRTDLTLATAEAEDARDGGLDLAQELAEVRAEHAEVLRQRDEWWEHVGREKAALRAQRERLRLAWQSAARGRRQARIERDRQGGQV